MNKTKKTKKRRRKAEVIISEWDHRWGNGWAKYVVECSECGKRFRCSGWDAKQYVLEQFKEHVCSYSGPSTQCPSCGKYFEYDDDFDRHWDLYHPNEFLSDYSS